MIAVVCSLIKSTLEMSGEHSDLISHEEGLIVFAFFCFFRWRVTTLEYFEDIEFLYVIATKVSLGESAMLYLDLQLSGSSPASLGFLSALVIIIIIIIIPIVNERQYVDVESNFGDSAPSFVWCR